MGAPAHISATLQWPVSKFGIRLLRELQLALKDCAEEQKEVLRQCWDGYVCRELFEVLWVFDTPFCFQKGGKTRDSHSAESAQRDSAAKVSPCACATTEAQGVPGGRPCEAHHRLFCAAAEEQQRSGGKVRLVCDVCSLHAGDRGCR